MRAERSVILLLSIAALTGCHPKKLGSPGGIGFAGRPLSVGERLTCPDRVEDLARTTQAADGQSCGYDGPDQEDVTISRTPLNGQPSTVRLAALDQSVRADVPASVSTGAGPGVYVGEGEKGKQAHIDLPGFHLDATDGKATIRMPGVSINANGDDANVTTGVDGGAQSTVHAHGGGAEIRTGGVNANGVNVTYLLASDTPGPDGYRVAGYMAKGPVAGPLVVGVFRVRAHEHHDVSGRDALSRLVNMNVGG